MLILILLFGDVLPAEYPRAGHIHRETFQRVNRKSEIPGCGHLEDFPLLADRERVRPPGASPVIPKLPEPAAHPARDQKRVKSSAISPRKISLEGRQMEAIVNR